jgi:hypothetical protein
VRYVCLFGAGLVASVSGTGWLMILAFIVTAVFSLGGRGIVLAIITATAAATALGGLALASPDTYHFLMSRSDEFTTPGSSGFLRFVTPWWLASDVLNGSPWVFLFGLGAGVSDHPGQTFAYEYNSNSTVKLLLDFGAPALVAFLSLFVACKRTRVQNALIAPIMVWLLLDGTNVEIPFVLLPCMVLLITADLIPATPKPR